MFDILKAIAGLIPLVIEAVKAVEMPGNGAEKAAAVEAIASGILAEVAPDFIKKLGVSKIGSIIQKVIGIAVDFLNKVGFFSTSKSGQTAGQ